MGVVQAEPPPRESPEMPAAMLPVYAKYKRIRFGRMIGDEAVTLIPRRPLQFAELAAYSQITGDEITPLEVDVIMSIDAIFEGSKHG